MAVTTEARVFAALGDDTRLALISQIQKDGLSSIKALADRSSITRQAITKHLDVLARAGLVQDQWSGRERLWGIQAPRLEEARNFLERISKGWDTRIDRLKRLVEQSDKC